MMIDTMRHMCQKHLQLLNSLGSENHISHRNITPGRCTYNNDVGPVGADSTLEAARKLAEETQRAKKIMNARRRRERFRQRPNAMSNARGDSRGIGLPRISRRRNKNGRKGNMKGRGKQLIARRRSENGRRTDGKRKRRVAGPSTEEQ